MHNVTNHQSLYFNGIDGSTGQYELPPMSNQELARFIEGTETPENLNELKHRHRQATEQHLGVKEGVDPTRLDEAGWGVIFAHNADPAIEEALRPLLDLRLAQAGDYFRSYAGRDGYRPGESKGRFLSRHGVGPGPADPARMPYYLLIVGDPETIPYTFQYQLDVQYAVGRIHFGTLQEYANYAANVVHAETQPARQARKATFFGVTNPDDPATTLSTEHLVQPLHDILQEEHADWAFDLHVDQAATKAQLARLLGGDQTPALLFSASHGMGFPNGHPQQIPHGGALLCQDWPGPRQWRQEIPQDFYFAGDDLAADANLSGLIAFCFACYGAGTPRYDDFAKQAFKERSAIAPHAFMAQLPTRVLGHSQGALATIGHVERAWGCSFMWPGADRQLAVFESTLKRLLSGHPVGSALEYFNERYAELSTVLSSELEEIDYGKAVDPYELASMWTANNDARSYAIIGDPAVRLPIAGQGAVEQEIGAAITLPALSDTTSAETPQWQPQNGPNSSPAHSLAIDAQANDSVAQANNSAAQGGDSALAGSTNDQTTTIVQANSATPQTIDSATLTVTTFATQPPDREENRLLKAVTHMTAGGEIENLFPAGLTADDMVYLQWHRQIVAEAIAVRYGANLEEMADTEPQEQRQQTPKVATA